MMDYFLPDTDRARHRPNSAGGFIWSLKSGQYDDLDGTAERILHQETDALIRKTPS